MKRILQILIFALICQNIAAQTTVKGEYISSEGKAIPKFAYLFTPESKAGLQAKIIDGKFVFEVPGKDTYEVRYGKLFFSNSGAFGGEIQAKAKWYKFVLEKGVVRVVYNRDLNYFKATGGLPNVHLARLNLIDSAKYAGYKMPNPDISSINLKANRETLELLKQDPTSPVYQSVFWMCIITLPQDSATYKEVSLLYQSLPQQYKKSAYGKNTIREMERLRKTLEKRVAMVGVNPTKLPLMKTDMTVENLFPNKSRLVLLDFWATWCGPCIKAVPKLNELQKKYGAYGFTIVGISMDKQAKTWKEYMKGKSYDYPHYWTDPEKARLHPLMRNVQHFPTYVLVDAKSMKVIAWDIKIDRLDQQIGILIKEEKH